MLSFNTLCEKLNKEQIFILLCSVNLLFGARMKIMKHFSPTMCVCLYVSVTAL